MTVAISLLVHGEAVRFNRGESRQDDFDFKYMRGRDGKEYPYVSSQCYKRFWRESLQEPLSPITREMGSGGKEKNQAYTAGNPIKYVDDDLFGYMIAGAAESEEERGDALESMEADSRQLFEKEHIKDAEALTEKLLEDNKVSKFIIKSSNVYGALSSKSSSIQEIQEAILQALNAALKSTDLIRENMEDGKQKDRMLKKFKEAKTDEVKHEVNKEFLKKIFGKHLQEKPKRPTTRRTAPIRMHALVAFSGIKMARDFQTFSRDVSYTGKNSVVNPNSPGIYSAWMKTRILIEAHRIGRFYIGANMDLLTTQVTPQEIKKEQNRYSRESETLCFIELDQKERKRRLCLALQGLANIGNTQGPASGALHDGSLRPRAFIAGLMSCVDSPFDDVWKGNTSDGLPFLDVAALVDAIKDWSDLFVSKKLYFGLPHEMRIQIEETIKTELAPLGFEIIIDSPRKALLKLSEEAVL
jgi:CRISPR-associated protein Cas7/Cst2/DevR subtype I-B